MPVINALTDEEHPLQALADLLTIRERLGGLDGVRVAWVGDGSNLCISLAAASALVGVDFVCACPAGYEPAGLDIQIVATLARPPPARTCSSPMCGRAAGAGISSMLLRGDLEEKGEKWGACGCIPVC